MPGTVLSALHLILTKIKWNTYFGVTPLTIKWQIWIPFQIDSRVCALNHSTALPPNFYVQFPLFTCSLYAFYFQFPSCAQIFYFLKPLFFQ